MAANMNPKKTVMPSQEPLVRARNFEEVATGLTEEMAAEEALRCLNCKNMPYVAGCPVNVHIPAFIAKVREGDFGKEYLAVVHGITHPEESLRDLLWRDKARKMSFVVPQPGKDVQEASLHYQVENQTADMSRVRIQLVTGRTHQIRAQFSGRGYAPG